MQFRPATVRSSFPALLVGVALSSCGCRTSEHEPLAGENVSPPAEAALRELSTLPGDEKTAAGELFERLPASVTGIEFAHRWAPRNAYEKGLLKTGFTGGGVCAGDYDGDGRCDVLLTRPHGGPRLLRNLGDFRFEDVTEQAGLRADDLWATGAVMADLNNDGLLDLVLGAYAQANRVYLNAGDGRFIDVSSRSGLDFIGATVKITLADYDDDGDLDAYCVTNRLEPRVERQIRFVRDGSKFAVASEFRELAGVINLPNGKQQFVKAGQFDHLYQNRWIEEGELRFVDVTEQAGIEGNFHGLDATWWDYNQDGAPDLYVANDFTDPDQLLRNNGDGTFSEVALESLPMTPWFTMATAVCDVNRDGRFDLLTADMAATTHYREMIAMDSARGTAWFLDTAEPRQYMRNALLLNTGTQRFMEIAHLAGVAASDWTWSTKVGDFDNDGRQDFFITNGFTRDYLNSDFSASLRQQGKQDDSLAWYEAPELPEANVAFRGVDDYRFESVGPQWGVSERAISFGAALADFDNDGDLDLVVNNFDQPPSVYRNRSQAPRIKLRLRGTRSNRQGIGATVTAKVGDSLLARYVVSTNGFMSADEPGVFLGVGDHTVIDELRVQWPSGIKQVFHDLAVNRAYEITEPKDDDAHEAGDDAPPPPASPLFVPCDRFASVRHREQPFDDFAAQPLLPHRLSQAGPGMAWADVDGDGDLDAFFGGAAGQQSTLLIAGDGQWIKAEVPAFAPHAACEDLAGLLFDADVDGDLDLLVVSGGVEAPAGDERLRDRLYLQTPAPEGPAWEFAADALPDLRDSGGAAAAFDFDRDGDLDLAIGGRVVPGAFPTAPPTRLLRNDRGKFTDVTEELAPELLAAGMVTGMATADFDFDGWIDLALAVEYGPLRVYRNQHGKFAEQSDQAGTAQLLGLWNSLLAGDVDQDGDIDLIAGNLGRNSRYQPTPDRPLQLFYGDFADGTNRIVEGKTTEAGLMPVRGRSVATRAIPSLEFDFPTYHAYASADLQQIYSAEKLQQALSRTVTTVDSGVLLNDGAGRFAWSPLPALAQAAPIFGMVLLYANDDQALDLFVAQNFDGAQRETGRLNGGLSLLLLGTGDGSFTAVEPAASGIVIPQAASAAVAMDLNQDGAQDLAVAINHGSPACYVRSAANVAPLRTILLQGGAGNPGGAGAAVTIELVSGKVLRAQHIDLRGYLSQSLAPLQIAISQADPPRKVTVRWTDGEETSVDVEPDAQRIDVLRSSP